MKTKKYTIICTAVSLVILIAVIVLALIKANKPAANLMKLQHKRTASVWL